MKEVTVICPACNGAGDNRWIPYSGNAASFKLMPCPRCKTKGRLPAHVCPTCHTMVPDDAEVEA